jgi:hypothetical protein
MVERDLASGDSRIYPLDPSTDYDGIYYLAMTGLDSKFLGLDLVFIRIGII